MTEENGENGKDVIGNDSSENDGNLLGKNSEINKKKLNDVSGDEGDALGNLRNVGGNSNTIARMPVEKYATHYNMKHKKRGIALIFNHEKFEIANLKDRAGTQQDCKNLKDCLTNLGFDVHDYHDLKQYEIEHHIGEVSKMNHTDNDCLLVAVLSHGETGIIYAKDMQYKPEHLWARFTADRCPTLAGKPKIFLLQACQGDQLDNGVILHHRTETDGQMVNSYRIPTQADFLIVYSTVKGYYSWRNTSRGSWFIQALCEELSSRVYDLDFVSLLTFVSQRVALDYESNVPDHSLMHQQKQIPCIMSMLTRMIQFNKKNEGLDTNKVYEEKEKSKNVFRGIFSKKEKQ